MLSRLKIERILTESLTLREREIVKLLFGFPEGYTYTPVEVARIWNVPPSRIQRICSSSIQKLKKHPKARSISEFFHGDVTQHEIVVKEIVSEVKNLTPELISHLRFHHHDMSRIPSEVFEHLIAELFCGIGYTEVMLLGRKKNTSADILAVTKDDKAGNRIRYFVEVKRWKDKVGVEVIDRVLGAVANERPKWGWHMGMIVSTAGFKDFRKYTRNDLEYLGLYLKDKTDILRWLADYRPTDKGLWMPPGLKVYSAG